MTVFELGAFGEFVGSVAVLVTLVYLSMQVRQNNKMARFETTREIMAQYNACNQLYATDATIRKVLLKSDELTFEEAEQLYSYVDMYCNAWATVEFAYVQGLVDETLFKGSLNDVGVALTRWPNMRQPIERWFKNYPDFKDTRMFEAISQHL
jgi:hypothetical protein